MLKNLKPWSRWVSTFDNTVFFGWVDYDLNYMIMIDETSCYLRNDPIEDWRFLLGHKKELHPHTINILYNTSVLKGTLEEVIKAYKVIKEYEISKSEFY